MRLGRGIVINLLGLVIVILIGLIGYYIWHQGYYFYSTNDATVEAPLVSVASTTPGYVLSVVPAGTFVNKGAHVAVLAPASTGGGTGAGASAPSNTSSSGATSSSSSAPGTTGSGSSGGGSAAGTSGSTSPGSPANGAGGGSAQVSALAPSGGTVIAVSSPPGQFVQPGQAIAEIVDPNAAYITALVDENNIGDVHVGQGVDINVDAASGTMLHGVVSQIVGVTAGSLALLPVNNYATGNFTKVSQRIPVRITFSSLQGQTLKIGASANVTIHLHD